MFWKAKKTKELDLLIAPYRDHLYRVALAWCGDRMLADDLTQETLTKALQKYHQLKDDAKLEHWLFRILNNCWFEYLRRQRPTEDLNELVLESPDDQPEHGFQKQQVVDRVRAAVGKLPTGQKQVLTLVDLQGFSYAEVSEVLDIPLGTVMSRLSRARLSLKNQLLSLKGELSPQKCHIRSVK